MTTIQKIPALPARPVDGHKGTFGRVLVIGGSGDMIGAPVFSALAALRMGCGSVQLAVVKHNIAACLSLVPEAIGLALPDSTEAENSLPAEVSLALENADALVIGPGLGQSLAAMSRVIHLLGFDKFAVIDADALNIISKLPTVADIRLKAVLTPHPGEMARLCPLLNRPATDAFLTDEAARINLACHAATVFRQVVLFKGHRSVITDGQRVHINQTGDSTLAKAGSGDILSGMIGSLLAQKMSCFEAATLGAHLHGLAGESAGKIFSPRSALAREVIDQIPKVIQFAYNISTEQF